MTATLFSLILTLAAEQPAVVVLQTESGALEDRQKRVVTQVLTYELSTHGKYRVVTLQDIEAQLGVENTKDMMGCDEVRCAAEIGMALNARYMLSSFAEPLGGSLFYSLNLIDTRTNATTRSQAKVPDAEAHYETAVRIALNELLNPELRKARPVSDQELAVSYAETGGLTKPSASERRPVAPRPVRSPPTEPPALPALAAKQQSEIEGSLDELVPACEFIELDRSRARSDTMLQILKGGQIPADDWPGAMATLGKHYVDLATCSRSPNVRRRYRMQAVGIFDQLLDKRPAYRERPLIERYKELLRRPPPR